MTIWHNQRLKDDETPLFSFNDRLRLGDGVFDTMLAVDGRLIQPEAHFRRLLDDALVLGIECGRSIEDLTNAAQTLLKQSRLTQGRAIINTLLTRGPAERGLMPADLSDVQTVMRAIPAPQNTAPVNAVISRTVRRNEGSALSRIKSVNYGDNILALLEARKRGANEAILMNNAGNIVCTTAGNLFILHQGKLYTPPLKDGVLAGVTRGLVIERYEAIEKSLKEEDILNAQGVFVSNSLRGFVPIQTLEGRALPDPHFRIDQDFHHF